MTVLTALVDAYDRLEGSIPSGYSVQQASYLVSIDADGRFAHQPILIGEKKGKKIVPASVVLPYVGRTSGVAPQFLWDDVSYVFGIADYSDIDASTEAGAAKLAKEKVKVEIRRAAFLAFHEKALQGVGDEGLTAFLKMLRSWSSGDFERLGWPKEMATSRARCVFALESERLSGGMLHQRQAAKDVWRNMADAKATGGSVCLVTGRSGPVARIHASLKGVRGAKSSGAALVSYNIPSSTSHGWDNGENAQVGVEAEHAYTSTLNAFLRRGSGHKILLGDTTTVFWAVGPGAQAAETAFSEMYGAAGRTNDEADGGEAVEVVDKVETAKIAEILAAVRSNRFTDLDEGLSADTKFYVLGLAPNVARLSIRFWFEGTFGEIADRYRRFVDDASVEPPPHRGQPSLWRYLVQTAVVGKSENIPPNLAGDWVRALLTGDKHPHTLLSTTLMRARVEKKVDAVRASLIKAILIRNFDLEVPVALDKDNPEPAYQLGRLFAIMEAAQREALGSRVNATISDRFYASASATPARVFPQLLRGFKQHVSDAKRRNRGLWIGKIVDEVMTKLPPDLPAVLRPHDQARFAIGYYHQRAHREPPKPGKAPDQSEAADTRKDDITIEGQNDDD